MNLSCKFTPLFLMGALLCCATPNAYAQQTPTCLSAISDADGDGWGWENNASCRVASGGTSATTDPATCIDSDGDGWGWDGVASCAVTGATTESIEPEAAVCVDPDGDGYGWDGVATCLVTEVQVTPVAIEVAGCIDSDGDGWGWNGTESCVVESVVGSLAGQQEIIGTPYMNRYETSSSASWSEIEDNPFYFVGPPNSPPNPVVSGWIDIFGFSILNICEDPGITLQDPSNPGFFYDAALGHSCAKSDTVSIPAPEPVEFTEIGIEVLYENGNQWNCIEESRPSMDSEFEANGVTASLTFDSGNANLTRGNFTSTGEVSIVGSEFRFGDWNYASPDLVRFRANVSYKDGVLALYRSGLNRLTCDRIPQANYPFTVYGDDKAQLYRDMWNAFIGDSTPKSLLTGPGFQPTPVSNLVKLRGDQLVGQTLQCALLYSRSSDTMFSNSFERKEEVYTVRAANSDVYDFSVNGRSDLWTQSAGREFKWEGVGGAKTMALYRYTDDLSLRFVATQWYGTVGTSKTQVYACESIAAGAE